MMTIKRSVYILDGKYDINIYSVYYSMFYEKYDIEDYIYIYQFLVIATSLVKCNYRFVWFPSSTDLWESCLILEPCTFVDITFRGLLKSDIFIGAKCVVWHSCSNKCPVWCSCSYNHTGTAGGEELWRHCISDTDMVLGFALGAMFVREVFHGENKHKVRFESEILLVAITFGWFWV